MMTEVERILDQYDRVMNGDAWHGDPMWKILDGISASEAASRAHPDAHSIWELVSHVTFWESEVYRRLNNLPARPYKELNFPAAPQMTAENWESTLAEFRHSNTEFRKALSQLEASRLDEPLSTAEKTVYVEVHGVIQHNLYHAGQIAILRKILAPK
jgi:uncharacterized damage-inducible protein DinB